MNLELKTRVDFACSLLRGRRNVKRVKPTTRQPYGAVIPNKIATTAFKQKEMNFLGVFLVTYLVFFIEFSCNFRNFLGFLLIQAVKSLGRRADNSQTRRRCPRKAILFGISAPQLSYHVIENTYM